MVDTRLLHIPPIVLWPNSSVAASIRQAINTNVALRSQTITPPVTPKSQTIHANKHCMSSSFHSLPMFSVHFYQRFKPSPCFTNTSTIIIGSTRTTINHSLLTSLINKGKRRIKVRRKCQECQVTHLCHVRTAV